MPLVQQNELWNALRTSYIPTVAYRIRMLVYSDEEGLEIAEEIRETQIDPHPVNQSGVRFANEETTPAQP